MAIRQICGPILLAVLVLTGCSDREPDPDQAPATNDLPTEDAERILRILEYFNRGVSQMERYEPAEAVKQFREVTRLAPGWITGRLNLGIALLNASADGKHAQAEHELDWVVANEPRNAYAHYSLGMMCRDLNRIDDAIAHFRSVLELHPEDADTHYQLAIVLLDRDPDAAREHLEQTLAAVPHHESAVYRLQTMLRRAGERERASALVRRFKALKDSKAGLLSSMKYGEMGRFANVIRAFDFPDDRPAGARAPQYADRSELLGLSAPSGGVAGWPGDDLEALHSAGAAAFQPGLAVTDLNGDGRLDICVTGSSDGVELYLWQADRFVKLVDHGISAREVVGVFPGDSDGDGDPDLYLTCAGPNRLYLNLDGRHFEDRSELSGTAGLALLSVGASWADADHDGDLDLYVANFCVWPLGAAATVGAPNELFRNNGDGSFTGLAAETGIDGGPAASMGVLQFDVDGDLDLDLYVINHRGANALFLNDRVGQYRPAPESFALLRDDGPGTGALLEDFDRNGLEDLLLLRGAAPPRLLLQSSRGTFVEDPVFETRAKELGRALGGLAGDLDLDGDVDLVLLDAGLSGALRQALLMNNGDGSFRAPVWLGPEQAASRSRGAVAADLDADGGLELLVTRVGQAPLLLTAEPADGAHWLTVIPSQKSERQGIWIDPNAAGMQVELKTGARRQIARLTACSGFLSSPPLEAHFGLGSATKADYVRLAWPDATLQSELEVAANQAWRIPKISRKPSSCPVLFCWDGERFSFVTDFLGVGGVGFFVAPGEYAPPDPTESVRIPPELIELEDGRYLLRVLEPLEEVAYIDQLELEVYDHPGDLELYPDERFTGSPPFPTGEPLLSGHKIFPQSAVDERGVSVRDALLEIDRVYRRPPRRSSQNGLVGYAPDHWVELDFGDQPKALEGRLILYLYGWVEYTYSHVNYAAYQSGLSLRSPFIEVPDGDGGWKIALNEAGFPAGLPRMMTVDVTDLPLRTDGRLRIRTNMEVYLDQVFLAEQVELPGLVRSTLTAEVAELRSFGYPREYSPDGQDPTLYDYQRLDHGVAFKIMAGDYTRFGDVRELLSERDDQFVIMGRGEEITLSFDARDLPPLRPGDRRTLVLRTVGYCKDMDLYTAYPDTVGPLPSRRMKNYPPAPDPGSQGGSEHPLRALQSRRIEGPVGER